MRTSRFGTQVFLPHSFPHRFHKGWIRRHCFRLPCIRVCDVRSNPLNGTGVAGINGQLAPLGIVGNGFSLRSPILLCYDGDDKSTNASDSPLARDVHTGACLANGRTVRFLCWRPANASILPEPAEPFHIDHRMPLQVWPTVVQQTVDL